MNKKWLWVVLAVAGITGLAMASRASAQPVLLAIGEETSSDDPSTPGRVTCVGGESLGGLYCSAETTAVRIRGAVVYGDYAHLQGPAAAMFDGRNTLEMNCNLDAAYRGRCWGTFEWTIPALGGKWEGTWSGEADFLSFYLYYDLTGFGRGGGLSHLKVEMHGAYPGGVYTGTIVARVSRNR